MHLVKCVWKKEIPCTQTRKQVYVPRLSSAVTGDIWPSYAAPIHTISPSSNHLFTSLLNKWTTKETIKPDIVPQPTCSYSPNKDYSSNSWQKLQVCKKRVTYYTDSTSFLIVSNTTCQTRQLLRLPSRIDKTTCLLPLHKLQKMCSLLVFNH